MTLISKGDWIQVMREGKPTWKKVLKVEAGPTYWVRVNETYMVCKEEKDILAFRRAKV